MTTIYWSPLVEKAKWTLIGMQDPELVLPKFVKNRNTSFDMHYTKCPAFQDYYKNTYLIRSPVDLTIRIDRSNDFVSIDNQNQDFYDEFVLPRSNTIGKNDPMLLSLGFNYMFRASEECLIELLPVSLHDENHDNNLKVICGTFDISKWLRPVNFAFEVIDSSLPIQIKRNDPLYYVRFVPKNGKKINLKYEEITQEIINLNNACVTLKNVMPHKPLHFLYKLTEKFHKKIQGKNKCPFSFFKVK